MRGSPRNIAILLALVALAVTGVAGSAEAKGGGAMGAAAAKVSRGAQIRLNRMKTKMALRTRGALQQKTRRQLRLGKRKMMRAMSRREVGLHGSEAARARSAFARDIDTGHDHDANRHDEAGPEMFSDVTPDRREEASGAKQGKKMRERARRRAESEHKKRRR
jgi:hypothetical protein